MNAENSNGSIVTVGTFDGLHRGHLLLLRTLADKAAETGLTPLAVTFDRHPLEVIAPGKAPKRLISPDRRDEMIRSLGIKPVRIAFNEALRELTAGEWIRKMADEYDARMILVGYDNTFGSDGKDLTPDDYAAIGRRLGVDIISAPVAEGISSSAVRKAIAEGRISGAREMLGRPFELEGRVTDGDKIGRKIGFPTANLLPDSRRAIPEPGVYAAIARLADGMEFPAVVNIGRRPTVTSGGDLRIEANLIGFSGSLYGQTLTLLFIDKLRDEMKFDSLDALAEAIETDKKAALALISASNFS